MEDPEPLDKVLFSSMSDHWRTPSSIFKQLDQEFKFTYDPSPLSPGSLYDGLTALWSGSVFCNPPFSQTSDFIDKGLSQRGSCDHIVFLVASRTDTKWFQKCLESQCEFRFIKGRLHFSGQKNPAPFPSVVIILK